MLPSDEAFSAEELLEKLLQDDDFEKLEKLAQPFNVFEVLGAIRQEVRHSNFLAWLLNPSQNHGVGDYFLKRFLWKTTAAARNRRIGTLTPLEVDNLDLDSIVVRREWLNIDVMLISRQQRFVCVIENKVFSAEHDDQLNKYEQACLREYPDHRLHLIYLSPGGDEPNDAPNWVPIGYDVVRSVVKGCLEARGSSLGNEVQIFIRHYLDMLRRHIMRESDIDELCQRIYAKHQQALDLLFAHRPDRQPHIATFLEDLVKANSIWELDEGTPYAVHFAPKSWEPGPVDRRMGDGRWTKSRRVLLFEFHNRAGVRLSLYIGPGDIPYRERILAAARATKVFKPTQRMLGQKWNRIWHTEIIGAEDYDQDIEWVEERIRERMATFEEEDFPAIDGAIQGMALWP